MSVKSLPVNRHSEIILDDETLGAIVLAAYPGTESQFLRDFRLILEGQGRKDAHLLRTHLARICWRTRKNLPLLPCSVLITAWRMATRCGGHRVSLEAWREGFRSNRENLYHFAHSESNL